MNTLTFLKSVLKILKDIWNWLDGKKTKLAAAYWAIAIPSIYILYPNGAPDALNKTIGIIGIILSASGLGHGIVKDAIQDSKDAKEVETPSV
jgi:hypothetical protein